MKTNTPSGMLAAMAAGKAGIWEARLAISVEDLPKVKGVGVSGSELSEQFVAEQCIIAGMTKELSKTIAAENNKNLNKASFARIIQKCIRNENKKDMTKGQTV